MSIDWDKPLVTRDGRSARLVGTIKNKKYQRVVAISNKDENDGETYEWVESFTEDGKYFQDGLASNSDLQNALDPYIIFVNVYKSEITGYTLGAEWDNIIDAQDDWNDSDYVHTLMIDVITGSVFKIIKGA